MQQEDSDILTDKACLLLPTNDICYNYAKIIQQIDIEFTAIFSTLSAIERATKVATIISFLNEIVNDSETYGQYIWRTLKRRLEKATEDQINAYCACHIIGEYAFSKNIAVSDIRAIHLRMMAIVNEILHKK